MYDVIREINVVQIQSSRQKETGAKHRHGNSAAGGRAERRSGDKQSQNLAPSMAESEQIARNDREMKLELASEAVGRGRPATRAVQASI